MNSFWAAFEKKADASKEEIRSVLKKHEERETPEQEAMESKHEQALERKAGIHEDHEKKAFWVGFEKSAAFSDWFKWTPEKLEHAAMTQMMLSQTRKPLPSVGPKPSAVHYHIPLPRGGGRGPGGGSPGRQLVHA